MINSALFKEVFYQSRLPQVFGPIDLTTMVFNHAFTDFLGYSLEELQHLSVKDLSQEEDFIKDYYLLTQLIEGKIKEYQFQKRFYHKNGDIMIGQLQVSLIKDEETGQQYILGQVFDLTEKIAIEQRKNESEKKYRLLAENSSDFINLHAVDGTYVYVSPSISSLGYCPDDLLGEDPFQYIHVNDLEEVKRLYGKVVNNGESVLSTYRYKKKDGSYIWLESTIKAVSDEQSGEVTQIISVTRDIEQRMNTYELLKKSEKLAVVGQMAAAVAHEIRNPLTPIKGFMQLLSTGGTLNPAYSTIVLNEIDRIDSIITEFLTLAKPNMEKQEIISIDHLIKSVIQLLLPQAMLKNKEIYFSIPDINLTTFGDTNSLKQVFINVIQNALDAIEEKGNVHIKVYQDEQYACIEIKDNGCGIPSDRIPNLGEPFYSTKEKGTGLGLMTSFKIIEQHEGKINIESEEAKGTTVYIYLPIK
ncbi:PAS domain S-box protein [Bacillus sp. 31A1R]|uniref:histidine kinase n=1 Tax=Robertmurraya mangrovi TaxID=3098077 RepID=A0ABU5J0T8_9BACI|nr:PAS domain S-box protein [Bacillus sp. 31A1R]MDZ5472982.1 PAS domain S-box protein [Bacillus sp. 31A1R]